MKKSDLYREYARVIDMCEGTDVKPAHCMKYIFTDRDISIPYHNNGAVEFTNRQQQDPSKFIFALAIVEGKPVFKGDVLCAKYTGKITVTGTHKFADSKETHLVYSTSIREEYVPPSMCSWNPPKPKTITVTIPRPTEVSYSGGALFVYFREEEMNQNAIDANKAIKEAMKS